MIRSYQYRNPKRQELKQYHQIFIAEPYHIIPAPIPYWFLCKVRHPAIYNQDVYVRMRPVWAACKTAAVFAAEPDVSVSEFYHINTCGF